MAFEKNLTPCRCGGEAEFVIDSLQFEVRIIGVICKKCKASSESFSYSDYHAGQSEEARERAIKAWNNLQSDINWKPIEELTEEWLTTQSEVLFFDDYSHVGSVLKISNRVCISVGDFEHDEYFNDIKKRYTYFAKLTPPGG